MKNKLCFIQLFLIGLFVVFTNSCNKEETDKPQGDGGISSVVFNSNLNYGIMSDQNGNTYKTIVIGTQTWMAENLRTTNYRNGDPIPNVTNATIWPPLTTGAYGNYENTTDKDKIATYGRLYNWFAVADSRKLAPAGWHIPTDEEWTTLTSFLGGESVAGGKMKEIGTTHWTTPNTGSTNESGFSATPTGFRMFDGSFHNLGNHGGYWSITQRHESSAWNRNLYNSDANCQGIVNPKNFGFAVRLVKD